MFEEIRKEEQKEKEQSSIYNVALSPLRKRRGETIEDICNRGIGIANADPPPPRPVTQVAPGIEEVEERKKLENYNKELFKKKDKPEERMLKRRGRSYKW